MGKRKLVISLVLGTIALSVLSLSASLAWYASSDRLQVNTIDVDLRTDESVGLFISTSQDKDSFKDSINKEELSDIKEFIPTSSMFHSRWMERRSENPLFYEITSDISEEGIKSEVGFFQQSFYLLSNISYYATISGIESVFEADKVANSLRAQALSKEIEDLTKEQIEEKLNNLVNCLRVSILVDTPDYYNYYIVDPTKKADDKPTYYAGRLDTSGRNYYDIDSYNKEIIYGEVENRNQIKYFDPVSDVITPDVDYDPNKKLFFGNCFEAKSHDYAYTFNKEESFASGVSFKEEPSISLEELESDDNPLLIPCYNGVATRIVLSIYLEGWDLDCLNETMGASFNTTLSFKLLRGII